MLEQELETDTYSSQPQEAANDTHPSVRVATIPNNPTEVVIRPPAKDRERIDKSLDRAKREVQRNRAFKRVGSFSKAYWILLLEQIRTTTRARNASLYTVNKRSSRLEPEVWFGDWPENEKPRPFEKGKGVAGTVWETGQIYLSGNVKDDPVFDPSGNPRSLRVRSILSVPILGFSGDVLGILNLDSYEENRFGKRLVSRIVDLQPKAYQMLRELGLDKTMRKEETISGYFWIFQKAIYLDYVLPSPAEEKAITAAVYNADMGEREGQFVNEQPSETIRSDYVTEVFSAIREELSPGVGKPGPSPVRLDRLWSVFQDRETEAIPLDDFEHAFADSNEPRKSAASAVSWLNNTFKRWGYDLEIETKHCTTYQLKPRSVTAEQ